MLNIQPFFLITCCLIYNAQKQFKLLLSCTASLPCSLRLPPFIPVIGQILCLTLTFLENSVLELYIFILVTPFHIFVSFQISHLHYPFLMPAFPPWSILDSHPLLPMSIFFFFPLWTPLVLFSLSLLSVPFLGILRNGITP